MAKDAPSGRWAIAATWARCALGVTNWLAFQPSALQPRPRPLPRRRLDHLRSTTCTMVTYRASFAGREVATGPVRRPLARQLLSDVHGASRLSSQHQSACRGPAGTGIARPSLQDMALLCSVLGANFPAQGALSPIGENKLVHQQGSWDELCDG